MQQMLGAPDGNIDSQQIEANASGQVTTLISDADIEYLNQYLASTCFTLINVNKDYFYRELHSQQNQATLRAFATDKKLRTLIVTRVIL